MKIKYKVFIGVLILIFLTFEWVIFYSPFGYHPQIQNGIQAAGIFVALLTAILAQSAADRKRRQVKIKIEASIPAEEKQTYRLIELSEELRKSYTGFPDPFESYQVKFRMTNQSGFNLEKPTLTFVLPLERQHPEEGHAQTFGEIYTGKTFHSNLYNTPQDVYLLVEDKYIVSKKILPYWNNKDSITIWIRMIIDNGKSNSFTVGVSINCANADGKTYQVKIAGGSYGNPP